MGSSGYLAAKSEREVYDYEIAMEKDEIALMPEIERDELALIYEAKGMDRAQANMLATQIMADPARMLQEQVQEELKIGEQTISPLREGWVTGVATAFGAVIPVFPFFLTSGRTAIILSFALSMLSHSWWALHDRSSPAGVFSGRGSTCSWSVWASPSSATTSVISLGDSSERRNSWRDGNDRSGRSARMPPRCRDQESRYDRTQQRREHALEAEERRDKRPVRSLRCRAGPHQSRRMLLLPRRDVSWNVRAGVHSNYA
jgi:hypothetical protein